MGVIRASLGAIISFLAGIAIHCGCSTGTEDWIAFGVILFIIGLVISATADEGLSKEVK